MSIYVRYGNPVGVLVLSVLGLIVWILGYRLIKVSYRTLCKGDMLDYDQLFELWIELPIV